jgi:hypothetical protein
MEGLKEGVRRHPKETVSLAHTLYSCTLHGDYVRTLGSSAGWSEKARVVGRNGHSDDQGTANIKEKNTPKDTTNGLDDVATRVLGFRSSARLRRRSQ